jgi:hypothetical protein
MTGTNFTARHYNKMARDSEPIIIVISTGEGK